MKMSYKGLKDIRIDLIKIWSNMCSFNASIGLLPHILIVSSNEDELYRFEAHTDIFHQDMCSFNASIGLLPPHFDRLIK